MGNEASKQRQRRPTEEKTVEGLLPIGDLHPLNYDFENIVFASGAAEGFSYAGAVRVLEKLGLLQKLKRFAGVGTGALVASFLAIGLNSDELQESFNKHLDNVLIDDQVGYVDLQKNFTETYGWNVGTKFFAWFSPLLESKSLDPDLTFMQLYEKTGKELCIVVANVDKLTLEYCHAKTTPDLPITRALFMSMSIPGIFSPIKYGSGLNKYLYVDGSMLCSYPIHSFDGWLLSMDYEDTILNQVDSPDQYQLDKAFNLKNTQTLGFFRICKPQETHYKTFIDRLTNLKASLKMPDTTLALKYKEASQKRTSATERFTVLRKTCSSLLSLASDLADEQQGPIPVDLFVEKLFADKSLRKDCQVIPELGDDKYDLTAFLSSIGDCDSEVSQYGLKRFVQQQILSKIDEYSGYYKSNVTDLRTYLAAVFDTVHYSNMNFSTSDYDRSVGILCGHIGTNDVYLEEDDQKYLYRQGWNATVSYLHQLK